jgi:hypothetical protein
MVYVAAERIGCSPNNIKARIEKSPALQEVLAQSKGYLVDTAELKLAQAVQAGDLGAIKFYLQTQAKDRGYVERREISGPDGDAIQVSVQALVADIHTAAERVLAERSGEFGSFALGSGDEQPSESEDADGRVVRLVDPSRSRVG